MNDLGVFMQLNVIKFKLAIESLPAPKGGDSKEKTTEK